MRALARRINLDKVGAVAGTICAVHCLLTGVAIGLLSVAGLQILGSTAAEVTFLSIATLIGLVAIVHGHKKHHSIVPALIFVLALVFIVVGHFVVQHAHGEVGHAQWDLDQIVSTTSSVLGGLCLVLFHYVNQRMQQKCGCKHCEHH